MYQELPKPKCGKCASHRSEIFHQDDKSGLRCLDCGHERITQERKGANIVTDCWVETNEDQKF